MQQQTVHAVRRSRHVDGSREIVCRCGFTVTGADCQAQADFDAHVRLARLNVRISSFNAWLLKRLGLARAN